MARKKITQYYDDLDSRPLDEAEVHTVEFTVDGRDYILDVSSKNLERFRAAIEPYIEAAREITHDALDAISPSEVRRWARSEGLTVAHRGKIPFDIVDAYRRAHA